MDDRRLSNERVTVVTVVAHIIQFSADLSVPLLYHTQETFVKVGRIKCNENGNAILFRHKRRHRRNGAFKINLVYLFSPIACFLSCLLATSYENTSN